MLGQAGRRAGTQKVPGLVMGYVPLLVVSALVVAMVWIAPSHVPDGVVTAHGPAGAGEWILAGVGFVDLDLDLVGQMFAMDSGEQWNRAFGVSTTVRPEPLEESQAYQAFKSVRPDEEPTMAMDFFFGGPGPAGDRAPDGRSRRQP